MKFTAKDRYTFIPAFNGNRDLPEAERLTVEIIRPKAEERGELYSVERVSRTGEGSGAGDKITYTYRHATGAILRGHIGRITNLTVDTGDGKETAVTDGKTLAGCPIYGAGELITELCNEVVSDRLREDEKKISASPLSSSTPDGTGKDGIPNTMKSGNNSRSDS
jgi:hypothetical protein